ncbi:DUF4153 domain-containing protein [Nocardia sp. NPDC051030]|uniref:DUF4153 domain-containing protein n=1 Tax=Nocardia sp. NPDC051030 TaxID=3155162 RepID=UPI00342DEC71
MPEHPTPDPTIPLWPDQSTPPPDLAPPTPHQGTRSGIAALSNLPPMRNPTQPERIPPRSARVPLPPLALPAVAVSGLAAVLLIPIDRPGLGWLLAGLTTTAAIYTVDRTARRTPSLSPDKPAAPTESSSGSTELDQPERAAESSAAGVSALVAERVPADESSSGATDLNGSQHTPEPDRPEVAERLMDTEPAEGTGAAVPVEEDSAEPEASDGSPAKPTAGPGDSSTSAASATADTAHAAGDAASFERPALTGAVGGAGVALPVAEDSAEYEASGASPAKATVGVGDSSTLVYSSTAETVRATEAAAVSGPENAGAQRVGEGSAVDTDRPGIVGRGGLTRVGAVDWGRVFWVGVALGLLGVGVVRAAPWLFVCCLVGAGVAGSVAVVGRRSVHGVLFDSIAVPLAAMMSAPWLYRGLERVRVTRGGARQRVWMSLIVTVGLLLVMVPLLAGADAVFARLVDGLIPELDAAAWWRWGFVFTVAGMGTAGALYLLAGPPPSSGSTESVGGRRFSRVEWALPMGALTVVFAVFVATQLAVMFGGDGYVQRTAGLTYAEYARSGFWELSAVSMLTLAVIAVVQRWAGQQSAGDRLWLRIAVGVVSVLTLIIVASALHRMWTYQQAYGFTVLRLLVEVFEVWIGFVYVMVLASLVRLRRAWVPRAAVGAAAVTLLALAVLNPERIVADRNIDRWQAGANLDARYLSELSADILPATDRLPEAQRAKILAAIRARLDEDGWQSWNLSRSAARP